MSKGGSNINLLAVPGVPHLYSARKGPLRMSAIQLRDESICLISPVAGLCAGLLNGARDPGKLRFLLAPNHYHNKGLREFADALPAAMLCAPEPAQARLERQTGLEFRDLSALLPLLPSGMEFLTPPGLKTGEVWLLARAGETRAWLVVDAFRGPSAADSPPAAEPELIGTFPSFGVQNAAEYVEWTVARTEQDRPNLLVPCHGALVAGDSLAAKLQKLTKSLL